MTDLDTHQNNNRRIEKRHNENHREWRSGREGSQGEKIERSGMLKKESEDERTGSKTVGAAFFVDEVSRNWSKKQCVNTSVCVSATKTKPEKKSRGANVISPPWQPGSKAQPGFPLAWGRTRKSRRGEKREHGIILVWRPWRMQMVWRDR